MASISPLWVKITDFGISKRWAGTALHTHCGTALYQAPELLGLLPRSMKTQKQSSSSPINMRNQGKSYIWGIDMWALGAVVHEMLTSEIPFTEIGPATSDFTDQSMTPGSSVDGEMLLDYCAGRETFPVAGLTRHRASATAIAFVKRLMILNPKDRVSAADELLDRWHSGFISTALPRARYCCNLAEILQRISLRESTTTIAETSTSAVPSHRSSLHFCCPKAAAQ